MGVWSSSGPHCGSRCRLARLAAVESVGFQVIGPLSLVRLIGGRGVAPLLLLGDVRRAAAKKARCAAGRLDKADVQAALLRLSTGSTASLLSGRRLASPPNEPCGQGKDAS